MEQMAYFYFLAIFSFRTNIDDVIFFARYRHNTPTDSEHFK